MPRPTTKPSPHGSRAASPLALALVLALSFGALLQRMLSADARAATAARLVCGLDDREHTFPETIRTGSRHELVPPGAVSLTVCRYNGMNAAHGVPQFGLLGVGATRDHRS